MYEIDFKNPIHIYFVGIGGISMSGLAEILLEANFKISGSDTKMSGLTEALRRKGATIFYGQSLTHLTPDVDLVVYTSAIHEDNPEYIAMQKLNLPFLSRAELLGQMMRNYKTPIAVSGTHGKTTTTSLISEILLENHSDPTLSIGGICKSIGGNIRLGGSNYFVTEACEYTNSFLSFFPKIGIILNIEEDHLDFFKDIKEIRKSFHQFSALLPEDGTLIINQSIDNVSELIENLTCRVLTFGALPECDYCYFNLHFNEQGNPSFDVRLKSGNIESFLLKAPGEHNVNNAVAAIALADILGISMEVTRSALLHFSGTNRRFEYKGVLNGVTIIDDYAHHPTEITATLEACKKIQHKTLWCVFQPHTYTRTLNFLDEFAESLLLADYVILADIYAARETDTLGISSKDLLKKIIALGGQCEHFSSFEDIENYLLKNCITGDLLITMGAGDVVKVGENLLNS